MKHCQHYLLLFAMTLPLTNSIAGNEKQTDQEAAFRQLQEEIRQQHIAERPWMLRQLKLIYKSREEGARSVTEREADGQTEGAKFTQLSKGEFREAARARSVQFVYQMLVNEMRCLESMIESSERLEIVNVDDCRLNLNKALVAMTALNDDLEKRFLKLAPKERMDRTKLITYCRTASRLLEIEVRYPPFAFMKSEKWGWPSAYNEAQYIDCIRGRL